MSPQARRLLWLFAVIGLGTSLSGIFVQVYLWSQGGSLPALVRFHLGNHLAWALAFLAFGPGVKRGRAVGLYRLSLALHVAFFLTVLAAGAGVGPWLFALGLVAGLAGGTFWVSQNSLVLTAVPMAEQERFWGYVGALFSASAIAGPLAGGWVIDWLGTPQGYHLLFGLSAACFAAALAASGGLGRGVAGGPYALPAGLRDRGPGRPWARVLGANVAWGFRDSILVFLPAVLVYAATGQALSLGQFAMMTSAAGMVANWAAGRLMTPRRRPAAMWVGAVLQVAGAAAVLTQISFGSLLAFSLTVAVVGPMWLLPLVALSYDAITAGPGDLRAERIVVREMALVAGRLLAMGALLALVRWAGPKAAPPLALTLAVLATLLPPLVLHRTAGGVPAQPVPADVTPP